MWQILLFSFTLYSQPVYFNWAGMSLNVKDPFLYPDSRHSVVHLQQAQEDSPCLNHKKQLTAPALFGGKMQLHNHWPINSAHQSIEWR